MERGSSHIEYQRDILKEEYDLLGLDHNIPSPKLIDNVVSRNGMRRTSRSRADAGAHVKLKAAAAIIATSFLYIGRIKRLTVD